MYNRDFAVRQDDRVLPGEDEFEGLSYGTDRCFARAQLADGIALEILDKRDQALPSPVAHMEPDKFRSVPVPPVGVTAGVFVARNGGRVVAKEDTVGSAAVKDLVNAKHKILNTKQVPISKLKCSKLF